MKKYLFILFIFAITYQGVTAQEAFRQELAIGASFGMNFSSVSFAPKVQSKLMQSFNAGLMLRWKTQMHLGLQAEINYSIQGWEEDFKEHNSPKLAYKREMAYVELPIMTHLFVGNKSFKAYLNVGPKISYLQDEEINSHIDPNELNAYINSTGKIPPSAQHDLKVQNKFDWGLCGGPGIEVTTKFGIFLLEGRYSYSFSDIFSTKRGEGDYFSKAANQVISVKIAYLFPLIK